MGKTEISSDRYAAFMSRWVAENRDYWTFMDDDDFPAGYCSDMCSLTRSDLANTFYGRWKIIHGCFLDAALEGFGEGHVWMQDSRTGIIADPTIGQFVEGPAWRLIPTTDPLFKRFAP